MGGESGGRWRGGGEGRRKEKNGKANPGNTTETKGAPRHSECHPVAAGLFEDQELTPMKEMIEMRSEERYEER